MEGYSDLITKKLEELAALAKAEGEPNVEIVINAIEGARFAQDDALLAEGVQMLVKDILLPRILQDKERCIAQKN